MSRYSSWKWEHCFHIINSPQHKVSLRLTHKRLIRSTLQRHPPNHLVRRVGRTLISSWAISCKSDLMQGSGWFLAGAATHFSGKYLCLAPNKDIASLRPQCKGLPVQISLSSSTVLQWQRSPNLSNQTWLISDQWSSRSSSSSSERRAPNTNNSRCCSGGGSAGGNGCGAVVVKWISAREHWDNMWGRPASMEFYAWVWGINRGKSRCCLKIKQDQALCRMFFMFVWSRAGIICVCNTKPTRYLHWRIVWVLFSLLIGGRLLQTPLTQN